MNIEKTILKKDAISFIKTSNDINEILDFKDSNTLMVDRMYLFDIFDYNKPYIDLIEKHYGTIETKKYIDETQLYNSKEIESNASNKSNESNESSESNESNYREIICKIGGYSNDNVENNLVDAISNIHIIDVVRDIVKIGFYVKYKNSNNLLRLHLVKSEDGRNYFSIFNDEMKPFYIKYLKNMELPFIHIIKKTESPIVVKWSDLFFNQSIHEKIQDNSINKITYELTNKSITMKYEDDKITLE